MTAVLEASQLTVTFGGLVACCDVGMTIPKGEIHGLIGPNGAGKTTFFNTISGLVMPESGTITYCGEDITRMPAHWRAAKGIRRTFQTLQLLPDVTVLENVLIGLHGAGSEGGSRSSSRGFATPRGERERIERVAVVLDFLAIGNTIFKPVRTLSFFEQRHVEIARALVSGPTLMLLDEPAAGLSVNQIEEFDRLLVRLRDEWGITMLLVEHVISLVMKVCDRITVLDRGRVIAEGTGVQIASDPAVKAAYLGDQDLA